VKFSGRRRAARREEKKARMIYDIGIIFAVRTMNSIAQSSGLWSQVRFITE